MGFACKNKLNLQLPYLQVDAAKSQAPRQGRTLRHGLGPTLSADLYLQPCQGTFLTGNSRELRDLHAEWTLIYTTTVL